MATLKVMQDKGKDEEKDVRIILPRPVPEVTEDAKKADSDFDDLEIEIDEDEVIAESRNEPPGRKF